MTVKVRGHYALVAAPKAPIAPSAWAGRPARLPRMDRLCALAVVAANQALLDGGSPSLEGARTAVVIGTAYGCHATNEDYYRGLLAGEASPRLFAYTLPSSPAGELSILHGITGPAITLASGRTAGLEALAEGARWIESGRADRALIVAVDVATPLLAQLTGLRLSDGACALLLEREADGAQLLGAGAAFGPEAQARAAEQALAAARLARDELDQVFENPAPEVLSAGPLSTAARFIREGHGTALIVASDPEGSGAAVVLRTGR